jgi:hypothetical protein
MYDISDGDSVYLNVSAEAPQEGDEAVEHLRAAFVGRRKVLPAHVSDLLEA